jgi:hypothetical protein
VGQLQVEGFGWIAMASRLQRTAEALLHQVHVQPSKYNRTGKLLKIGTMLNVRDPALPRWRRRHPELVHSNDDYVCGHLLGYASGRANGFVYGEPADGDVDLTDPATREDRLRRFVAMFRNSVVPWFAEASEPESIVASRAGEYTNRPVSVVEWLASRGRPDLIISYADRYLSRNSWAREPFDEASRVRGPDCQLHWATQQPRLAGP